MARIFKQKQFILKGESAGTWLTYSESGTTVTKTESTKSVLGTSSSPYTLTTAGNVVQVYHTCSAATGTARANYSRLYLSGGAGGEAGRFFTTVQAAAPVDTCNGVHCSLNFGASAGNITGLGTAGRFTLHVNARSITGTTSAIQAELYGEASGAVGGTMSCIRTIVDGSDATAKANIEAGAVLLHVVCTAGAYNSGKMVSTTNSATITGALKINVNGTTKWIPYVDSLVAP